MRRGLARCWVVAALLALAAGGVHAADPFGALDVERPRQRVAAPDFRLPTLDGNEVRLSQYRGKVILLNFWATWCRPCREEMPSLQKLWAQFRGQDFVILAVAADRGNPRTVARFAAELNLDFPILLDPAGEVRRHYEVYGLPMTYLIGRDGRISGRAPASRDWHSPAARALIEQLLAAH